MSEKTRFYVRMAAQIKLDPITRLTVETLIEADLCPALHFIRKALYDHN
jgi:hypothetical protein